MRFSKAKAKKLLEMREERGMSISQIAKTIISYPLMGSDTKTYNKKVKKAVIEAINWAKNQYGKGSPYKKDE